ncbi:MAG: PadR family transcriptional regulator [Clostridia bacterium]|nr:PadR family transcriptional regulator [Clostridia bacterium]
MAKGNEALTESYFYILLCLKKSPLHGYGIMQETLRLSGGRLKIGSGTMYGATGNMIKKGWIKEIEAPSDGFERKRMYELTEEGERVLDDEVIRLRELVKSADEVYSQK